MSANDVKALVRRARPVHREPVGDVRHEEEPVRPKVLFSEVSIQDLNALGPVPQRWWWDGYIPASHVTLFGGHGGAGKSTVNLMLGACIGVGLDFLGNAVERGNVLFFSAEDPAPLLRQRLTRICRALDIDPAELAQSMRVIDATDLDATLYAERRIDGMRVGATTATYEALQEYIEQHAIDVVLIDNSSDVYDGDEIVRKMVRGFIASLARLVRPRGGAVVLMAHVDKTTSRASRDATIESYSGSTAWHNSVRSRLFLLEKSPGQLELQHQKWNLGPKRDPLQIIWPTNGLPTLDAPASGFVAGMQEKNDTRALMRLIHEFYCRGEFVATLPQSRNNAAKVLSEEKTFPSKRKAGEIFSLLRDAERAGLVKRETYKDTNRKQHERWALTDEGYQLAGVAPCAPCAPCASVESPVTEGAEGAPCAPCAIGGTGGDRTAHFGSCGSATVSASAAILTRSWPVGTRTCTLSISRIEPGATVQMCVEWTPSLPKGLTASERHQYRSGRDAALDQLAAELGITVAVVEL